MEIWEKNLVEWQRAHCIGCKFTDTQKVGTGKPCCTFPGNLETGTGPRCETRRDVNVT